MKKQRKAQLVLVSIGLLLILLTYIYPYFLNKNETQPKSFLFYKIDFIEDINSELFGSTFVLKLDTLPSLPMRYL